MRQHNGIQMDLHFIVSLVSRRSTTWRSSSAASCRATVTVLSRPLLMRPIRFIDHAGKDFRYLFTGAPVGHSGDIFH